MLGFKNDNKIPGAIIFTFLVITIIISITGFYLYHIQKEEIKSNIYSELSFISKSKLEQVIEWRNNRLSDAYKIEGNQSFIYDVQKWLNNRDEKGLKQRIEKFIEVIQRDSNYANVYLIDSKFNIRLALGGTEKLGQFAKKNLLIVSKTKKNILTDLHRAETYSQIHLDLIIPLILTSESKEEFIGLMMIRIIPSKYLYPTLQSWPTQSKSAEALLIRREQNQVLFLNELRHKKNTALKFTASLSDTNLPAASAMLGVKGIFEGIDYRGVKVLADLNQIPGTTWSMVTKVDLEEIYSPLRERALLIFFFALALIIIAFVSSVSVWRHQKSVFYRERYKLETERKALEKHFAYLVKNANDIILLFNEGGKVVEANDRALSVYGYTRDEFLELNISDIRSDDTTELITQHMEEVTDRNGLIFETRHRKKDGTTFPVEASSRSIDIENAVYYQSIIRDITERKQTEEKIERLNRMYSFLSQVNQAIVRAKEKEKLFNEICEIAIKFGKFNLAWLGLIDYGEKNINIVAAFPNKNETIKNSIVNYTDKTSDVLVFEEAINTQSVAVKNEIYSGRSLSDSVAESHDGDFRSVAVLPIRFENKIIGVFTVYSSEANYFDAEQIRLFDEVGMDISFALEKIKAEKVLLESKIKFKNLFENAPSGIVMLDELNNIISFNKGFENIFQYALDEIKGRNINDVIVPDQFVDEAESLSNKSFKGEVVKKETIRKRKDGSFVNVEIYGIPIIIENKQAGIYGMYVDITERKIAETNLRENQKLLSTVIETMPIGIWLLDAEGNIMHGNTAVQRIWAGAKYVGLEKYEEYKGWYISTGKKVESGDWAAARCLHTGESIIDDEVEIECFDGQHKIILNSAVPIIDSHKKIAGVIVVNQDITERKRIEKQLETERITLRTLIDTLHDRIYFKDKECRFLLNNIAHIKALGCKTQEEVFGKTDFHFRNQNQAQRYFEDDLKIIETGEPLINREEDKILESGEKKWTLVTKVPLKDDKGNVTSIVGISHDITKRKLAEEEMVKSVSLLEATFESTADGLLVVDTEGKIVQLNQRFAKLWHISNDILATRDDNKVLAFVLDQLKYPEVFLAKVAELYSHPEATSFDLLEFKDGRVFERYSQPQKIDGKSVGRVWSFRDITERKKTEEALKESEEKFRSFSEESPNMIFINKQGRVVYVNRKCVEVMGYSREEFLNPNFNFLDLIIPEYVESVKENFAKRYKGDAKDSYEYALITKDKKRIEVSIASKIINYEGGKAILGNVTDITERKLADDEIRKLYRGVEQSPATVMITNTKGNIEYVNAKFCEITGYTLAEVIGNNPRILNSGKKTKEEYEELWKTILSGNEWRGEFHNKKKDGEYFWELASISSIKNEKGEITHFIAIKEDITDRKRMIEELIVAKERAEKSERIKSEFLAQISHEIRTPINIILGYNIYIKEELEKNLNNDLKESFAGIESATKRIMRTVDMVLNMSELQTGTVTASPRVFDLDKGVLAELCREYKIAAERKKLSFIYRLATNNTTILADDYCISKIFDNLIDNAIKYTNSGEIEVFVNRDDQNKLYIEVKDTGIGISKEFLPQLFDTFTQEEQGYSRKYDGNGLGLALVKNYCELNNAQIEVESTKGAGSKFRVTFH